MTHHPTRPFVFRRLLPAAVAVLLCLPLSGCFTAGLWTSGMRSSHKAGLTPLALALDTVTLPVQLAIAGHGYHGRGHHGHHSHRCR